MLVLVAVHLVGGALLPLLARPLGRLVWAVAALPALATLSWALARAPAVLDGRPAHAGLDWAPSLGLRIDMRLDPLALVMTLVVAGVGLLVLAYGAFYYRRANAGREAGLLVAFAGVMTGLVLADNLLLLYVFWELTTVVSFLLIAGARPGPKRRRAAEQALLTTVLGGLALLLGVLILGHQAGTFRLSAVLADPPRGGAVTVALVLVLVGAFTKSAQVPFHSWLPAAMVAPTPVSAFLHAATMVKAGVYLVARLAPGFADVPPWRPLVLAVGATTMVLAAWRALRETDLKRLLAYGTISELGLLTALLGAGTRTAALAGTAMLLAHALFKSSLFLVTGVVERATGTRDMRRLSGLGARLPATCAVAVLAAASMAKLPPLLGYPAEDAVYAALLEGEIPGERWVLVAVVAGSAFTLAFTGRYVWGAFTTKPVAEQLATQQGGVPRARSPLPLLLPAAVPAALAVLAGGWAGGTDALLAPYAHAFAPPEGKPYHLALWHGVTAATLLAWATLLGGAALLAAGRRLGPLQRGLPRLPDAQNGYRATIRGLSELSVRVTRFTQIGSLPAYLTVVLATVVVLGAGALLFGASPIGDVPLWRTPAELAPALIALGAAVAATASRQRLAAVLLTGTVGYGVAGLFVVRDAPDLALTQFLVESLTLVVMVLMLRRLPPRFTPERPNVVGAWVRSFVAVAIGAMVAIFALVTTDDRRDGSEAPDYAAHLDETGATNAVNAIIVDFRALDTVGEISVLLVTTIGVVSLVRVWGGAGAEPGQSAPVVGPDEPPGPRRGAGVAARSPSAHWDAPQQRWLPGAGERPGTERSMLLEILTRALFTSIVVLSLFLLFSGHLRPGGGFAGGLVAGLGFVLRFLVGGRADLGLAAPVDPGLVAGGGLVIAAGGGLLPIAFGAPPLAAAPWEFHAPVFGTVHGSTSLILDIGIYLLVVGIILKLIAASGQTVGEAR
ncbi:Na+/H+ antiporter subunit A [Streptomyces radicis]|uniref:Na+/H+ antiporter subunit A n=2 Tax=Streptomyces radicis TaxID=1750517 RepID=A0A3A9W570_9ACTN|nr:Na+/H+ antiporter subunit A [Streptomyces radicis]RKN07573.1 Na+/H+ antiporter subunit A [Streptomyces radicis]